MQVTLLQVMLLQERYDCESAKALKRAHPVPRESSEATPRRRLMSYGRIPWRMKRSHRVRRTTLLVVPLEQPSWSRLCLRSSAALANCSSPPVPHGLRR